MKLLLNRRVVPRPDAEPFASELFVEPASANDKARLVKDLSLTDALAQSGLIKTIETLHAIARRYRDLEVCTKDLEARQTFASIAEEYEQRADHLVSACAR